MVQIYFSQALIVNFSKKIDKETFSREERQKLFRIGMIER